MYSTCLHPLNISSPADMGTVQSGLFSIQTSVSDGSVLYKVIAKAKTTYHIKNLIRKLDYSYYAMLVG